MTNDYEAFCLADRTYYDVPANAGVDLPYSQAEQAAPPDWRRQVTDHWAMFSPVSDPLPAQGWKVHVAGCHANAERIIDAIWHYCTAHHLSFKFLRSPRVVLARNAKYADRGGSGKLVTIYPRDDAELERVCRDLDERLAGEPGPYILSDLRWGAGPVHVRYGGFTPRYCLDGQGRRVPAIADGTGTLVPDVRGPVFRVPEWLEAPSFLAPHLAARVATNVAELSYTVDEALHFSNGGGVYRGTDRRTGTTVVLKEARPHAGLGGDGTDALTRLRSERDALERLAGVEVVPHLLDHLTVGEHEFLVMEHIDGEGLNKVLTRRQPLVDPSRAVDPATLADHVAWAMSVHRQVEAAVAEIHARGLVYGDLHLSNILERPDGRVALIDFEVAADVAHERRAGLGAVGFVAPADRRGFDVDHYALACLRLALFVPLERLLGLDPAKAAHLASIVGEQFPVPQPWLDRAVEVITGEPAGSLTHRQWSIGTAPGHGDGGLHDSEWTRVRDSIAAGILASGTPERHDRLFPGDIRQFDEAGTGGLGVAHGAAGVLLALHLVGVERHPEHEAWLIEQALASGPQARPGLYDGLSGVAHVLGELGHHHTAAELLERCLAGAWKDGGDDLYAGAAGLGLVMAHAADRRGDATFEGAAQAATDLVVERLGSIDDVAETSGGAHPLAGLMYGSSGRALLLIRMYERTGDAALLDHARVALGQDLRRCVRREAGGDLHVNEGWRTLPYLAVGSVGIGLVLRRYLVHRSDDALADALAAVTGAACSPFYIQSGLFNGRAGTLLYLADMRAAAHRWDLPGWRDAPAGADGHGLTPDRLGAGARTGAGAGGSAGPPRTGAGDDDSGGLVAALADQTRRLGWHALTRHGHLAFPGDQLLRLSSDLATGSAGVLLALGAAWHHQFVHLPFLGPVPPIDET
jgi:hypothetical protein